MGPRIDITREFTDDAKVDVATHAPYWVIAVVRLAKPVTYSRKKHASVTDEKGDGARANGKTLVITGDCTTLRINRSKASHIKTLQASLKKGSHEYLQEIMPGDWIFAWMVHFEDKGRELVDRILNGNPCNGWDDGLKFVGRVDAIFKEIVNNRGTGGRTVTYSLSANAFKELDTQLFYDPDMAERDATSQDALGTWLAKIGLEIEHLFPSTFKNGGQFEDNVHVLVPSLFELLLGKGASATGLNPGRKVDDDLPDAISGGVTDGEGDSSAPFAYLVPKEVGQLLGKSSRDSSKLDGILAYADIMELNYGIQKFTSGDGYRALLPETTDDPPSNALHHFTGSPMIGAFLPIMPNFTNQPLWSVMQQYLNPTVNEMFTSLRVSITEAKKNEPEARIVPTLTIRQIPFTTPAFQGAIDESRNEMHEVDAQIDDVTIDDVLEKNQKSDKLSALTSPAAIANEDAVNNPIETTPFMSLPRWIIPAALVDHIRVGRTDALRVNFIHIYGQAVHSANNMSMTELLVNNHPIRDDLDIQRSGLHSYMTTIACTEIAQIDKAPQKMMQLVADWAMGQHLTLQGSISCIGIQSPIAEGDNVEIDGVVFHIESISDSCMMSPGGARSWVTTLQLANGLSDTEFAAAGADATDGAMPVYPGVNEDSAMTNYDPGISVEERDNTNAKSTPGNDTPTSSGSGEGVA